MVDRPGGRSLLRISLELVRYATLRTCCIIEWIRGCVCPVLVRVLAARLPCDVRTSAQETGRRRRNSSSIPSQTRIGEAGQGSTTGKGGSKKASRLPNYIQHKHTWARTESNKPIISSWPRAAVIDSSVRRAQCPRSHLIIPCFASAAVTYTRGRDPSLPSRTRRSARVQACMHASRPA
jgi:hypothetical protein